MEFRAGKKNEINRLMKAESKHVGLIAGKCCHERGILLVANNRIFALIDVLLS